MSRLREIFDTAAVSSGAVGAQVSAIIDGERLDFIHGSANLELNTPMTVDTLMQVGSVCKVFNAALIMTLVEERRLALDAPVIEYLPDLRLADEEARRGITLHHLLSMSSGLDNGPYDEHGRGEEALGRYVASLSTIPQIFAPGFGFGYSNAGASLAGYVAERVTGVGWDGLMRERILDAAGLKHALTLAEDMPFHRVSAGHERARNGSPAKVVRPWYVTRAQGPSGSTLTMSARDLASFGKVFLDGGKTGDGHRLLSQASVDSMMTPTTPVPINASFAGLGRKWGLGPNMDVWDGATVWGHGGGNRSGTSRVFWFPEKRAVLAAVVNTYDADEVFMTEIFGEFCQSMLGVRARLPAAPDRVVPLENPWRFLGRYERYGMRYEIDEASNGLRFTEVNLGTATQLGAAGVIRESALIPLGGDCFLIESTAQGRDVSPPSQAVVAFSGADAQGRAGLLLNPFLAARRIA